MSGRLDRVPPGACVICIEPTAYAGCGCCLFNEPLGAPCAHHVFEFIEDVFTKRAEVWRCTKCGTTWLVKAGCELPEGFIAETKGGDAGGPHQDR